MNSPYNIPIRFTDLQSLLRLRQHNGRREIFDPVRRKYVALAPEEWLRQLLMAHFLHEKNYPLGRMRSEMGVRVNGQLQRCDIAVFDAQSQPWLVVECKSPHVRLTQAVFEQAARYNMPLQARYLAVSNGLETYCAHIDFATGRFNYLQEFPNIS